jgi:hypothetical protein
MEGAGKGNDRFVTAIGFSTAKPGPHWSLCAGHQGGMDAMLVQGALGN